MEDQKEISNTELSEAYAGQNAKQTPGLPGTVVVPEDPAAPSKNVSSRRQRLSDLFTIVSLGP